MRLLSGSLVLAYALCAQTPDASVQFEVASVKPAAPQGDGRMMVGSRGGPGTIDPGRYTATNATLKMMLASAYDLKSYQISGPSWLDSERFDVTAKIPPGATKEQFRTMQQNLLIERFHITLHLEKKDQPIYNLVVGKNGPKLKPTEVPESAFLPADGGRGGAPPPPPPPPAPGQFPKMPAGRPGMMMFFAQSAFRLAAQGQTMAQMANFLSMQTGRPVMDKTGLTGKYDFQLEFAPEPGQSPMRGMPMPPPGAAGGPAGDASDPMPTLFGSIQELGLKLEATKGPVDLLVVDKADKVPVEN